MQGHSDHVYDPSFTTKFVNGDPDRRSINLHGKTVGGFLGTAAVVVPDSFVIDSLNMLFEVTHQVAGDQAEVSVKVAPWASEIAIYTLAPRDDDQYNDHVVRITADPILAGITNIRDKSVHLLEGGDLQDWHVENDYNFRHGFVSRQTLRPMPPSPNVKHVNPGQYTFVFHLGLRLSDADSMAYPVIMDGSLPDIAGEDSGRMFDLGEEATDRVIFLGTGVLRMAADYGISGHVDRAYYTADESPLFILAKTTRRDREGNVLSETDGAPIKGPSPETIEKIRKRIENMGPKENVMGIMLDAFGEETGKDVSGLRGMFGIDKQTPEEGFDLLGGLLMMGMLNKLDGKN